ncbi:hypothetical protein ACFZAR_05440 [Streptomyces sp. NPDC008222]|uniref:hypothetical protein n=1 Tax=Streptomyces sp. NPDC008222 TaxID=3364820 RepID=UPI0036E88BAC
MKLDTSIISDISIYPVGLLADLAQFVHNPNRAEARRKLRYALSHPLRNARARNWRAVRSYFNGYLAEHPTAGSRAGHGWTRGRAYRDLARHLHSDPRDGA